MPPGLAAFYFIFKAQLQGLEYIGFQRFSGFFLIAFICVFVCVYVCVLVPARAPCVYMKVKGPTLFLSFYYVGLGD